ncbi:MAG: nickel-dependent hydrogenase large subunit [Zestosphaera sp.]
MSSFKLHSEVVRVAGESEVTVIIESGKVKYDSVVSPRSFESLVKGRRYREVPYIVSRICGVCSHAHFWASNLAIESALGVSVDDVTAALRDVCNKVQLLQNHLIHLAFLALPDYNKGDVAKNYLSRLLKFNRVLDNVLQLLGGRLTNPNIYTPGGFTVGVGSGHVERALEVLKGLDAGLKDFVDAVLKVDIPDLKDPSPEYVAMRDSPLKTVPKGGPYILDTSRGSHTVYENYREVFVEQNYDDSTSKKCLLNGRAFYVGARARLLNLIRHGTPIADDALKQQILSYQDLFAMNPFSNIYAKALESMIILEDVVSVLNEHRGRESRAVSLEGGLKGGEGVGIIEAPRGLLIHHYVIDSDLKVVKADIITPTVMFSRHIEAAGEALLRDLTQGGEVREASIMNSVEALVRAYDPCIPCAVHVFRGRRS